MARRMVFLLILALVNFAVCMPNMTKNYDIIVIGLGSAGVTAASTLAKAGKKVLGLEAQDRIGGRVNTVPFGDGIVELGAEWIHGTKPSRVYDLAVQNNVTLLEQDLTSEVFRSEGARGNKELINELIQFSFEAVEDPPKDPIPLGQHITAKLMDYLKEKHPDVLKDEDFIKELLEMLNLLINNYEATNDWNDISTSSQYTNLEGHLHTSWHRHGYKTFFEILLNTYKNGPGLPDLDIKLNKEVTQIKWPKDTLGNVEVVCKDGEKYTAGNVIVTVSLGVLKERHSNLFQPLLPQEKINMIESVAFGVMDKIIFEFDTAWWETVPDNFFLFQWRGQDKRDVSRADYWTTRIFGCSTPVGSKNALTLWTSGSIGKLVETLPEQVVKAKCMELLRKFMGKKFTIPEPTGMLRSTWYSNPYTRGSYSYDNLLMPKYPNARAVLAEPLLDAAGTPKVLFAGEATHLIYYSTVHGASDTGYREAMRLLPASKI